MIRVVLDPTSSFRVAPATGTVCAIVRIGARRLIQLCVTGEVYAEYEEVIRRPRFRRSEEVIESALQAIREKGFWVRATRSGSRVFGPGRRYFSWSARKLQKRIIW